MNTPKTKRIPMNLTKEIIKPTEVVEPKTIKQGKVKVMVNEVEYVSICAGLRAHNLKDTDHWFKIRRELKKVGISTFLDNGIEYTFVQL